MARVVRALCWHCVGHWPMPMKGSARTGHSRWLRAFDGHYLRPRRVCFDKRVVHEPPPSAACFAIASLSLRGKCPTDQPALRGVCFCVLFLNGVMGFGPSLDAQRLVPRGTIRFGRAFCVLARRSHVRLMDLDCALFVCFFSSWSAGYAPPPPAFPRT